MNKITTLKGGGNKRTNLINFGKQYFESDTIKLKLYTITVS